MRLKVCGLTHLEELRALDQMGVDFAGFIFYPKSPRYVLNKLSMGELKSIQGTHIQKVGVFVNAPVEQVIESIDACGLQWVQLHGDESPTDCEKISNYVSVTKAFRLNKEMDIEATIKAYHPFVDRFLFDKDSDQFGGTGEKFDWKWLDGFNSSKPYFLSGGIGPDDLTSLHSFVQNNLANNLFALDINSCFELSPGVKNLSLVNNFLNQIKMIL